MKRVLFFALNALMLVALSSCGSEKEESNNTAPTPGIKPQPANQVIMPTTVTGKVFLAGDSLVCIWPESSRPKSGWGEYLQGVLGYSSKGAVPNVVNKAISGRSTKSFITSGDWDTLIALVAENDLVLIQFAANDGSTADKGCTPAEYATNLKKFISETRAKNAWPVLVTPPNSHVFNESGTPKKVWTGYTNTMRNVATETATALVDCQNMVVDWLKKTGASASAEYYMSDDTHLTDKGAALFAGMIADSMKEQGLWP